MNMKSTNNTIKAAALVALTALCCWRRAGTSSKFQPSAGRKYTNAVYKHKKTRKS